MVSLHKETNTTLIFIQVNIVSLILNALLSFHSKRLIKGRFEQEYFSF